jgi:hypothetical protein
VLQNKVQPNDVSNEPVPLRDSDWISDNHGSYVFSNNHLQEVLAGEPTPIQAKSHRTSAK